MGKKLGEGKKAFTCALRRNEKKTGEILGNERRVRGEAKKAVLEACGNSTGRNDQRNGMQTTTAGLRQPHVDKDIED